MPVSRRFGIGAAAVGIALLAGCVAPSEPGDETPSADPSPTPTETASNPSTSVPVFEQPDRCADILTPATQAAFKAQSMDLLGGPDGLYGGDYFAEETAEELAGGITCG